LIPFGFSPDNFLVGWTMWRAASVSWGTFFILSLEVKDELGRRIIPKDAGGTKVDLEVGVEAQEGEGPQPRVELRYSTPQVRLDGMMVVRG
jgi:hypothetical protein